MPTVENVRDVARFFASNSIQVRPAAAKLLLDHLLPITYNEQRVRFLDRFSAVLREWQRMNRTEAVVDEETVARIVSAPEMANFDASKSKHRSSVEIVGGFKAMKRASRIESAAQAKDAPSFQETFQQKVQESGVAPEETMQDLSEDRMMGELKKQVVIVGALSAFPKIRLGMDSQVAFDSALVHSCDNRNFLEVKQAKFDYFAARLALAAERIFSHVNKYQTPKLSVSANQSLINVHSLHSCRGNPRSIWVYGLLTQREDGFYYLEDASASVRLNFGECEYADPESFFSEGCILMCLGRQSGGDAGSEDEFNVQRVEHPPVHANKSLRFKLKSDDYFGAYSMVIAQHQRAPIRAPLKMEARPQDQSAIFLNLIELDSQRQLRALEQLLQGVEAMRPRLIVCTGKFFSDQACENASSSSLFRFIEQLSTICKELPNLLTETEWVFIPSLEDPAQVQLLPLSPLPRALFTGALKSLRHVTLATNPCRICFFGKEIVVCRFNFLRKLKQNHLAKIEFCQKKVSSQSEQETGSAPVDDCYRVAKTILRQAHLLPLPQIVQPVMWSHAKDALNLTPEPDFLVLADECRDYYYPVPLQESGTEIDSARQKVCHVLNPGNFSSDYSFAVVYPLSESVEPSKIEI